MIHLCYFFVTSIYYATTAATFHWSIFCNLLIGAIQKIMLQRMCKVYAQWIGKPLKFVLHRMLFFFGIIYMLLSPEQKHQDC